MDTKNTNLKNGDNDNLVISEAKTAEEIKTVALLASDIWQEYYTNILDKKQIDYMVEKFQSVTAIANAIKFNSYHYFIVKTNDEPDGYFALSPSASEMFISKIYLKAASRGKGIGTIIISFIKTFAAKKGLRKLWLTVNRKNTNSIAVYKKLGFVIAESSTTEIGEGFVMDDYVMRLVF